MTSAAPPSPEIVVGDVRELAEAFAARFEMEAGAAIADRGRFSLALPGGSVASSFLPVLARRRFDWARVDVFWGDERAVAPDDPASNYGLARQALLDPAHVPVSAVHRMPADEADLDAAAARHAATLAQVLGTPPVLDLVLLGVGPDGHVCSLFPGHPALDETARTVVAVHDAPKPPPRRLTLTRPVVCAARLVVVGAMGAEKEAAVKDAIAGAASPLGRVLRGTRRTLLLLDPAAAGRA